MQVKIILLVAVGAVMVLGSAAGTLMFVRQAESRVATTQEQLRSYGALVSMPVLMQPAESGARLSAEDFTYISVPESIRPSGILQELPPSDAGFVALTPIPANQLLLPHQILLASSQPDENAQPTADPQVLTISAENMAEVEGDLSIGDTLDLFWVRSIGGGSLETRLLASGVRVLATIAAPSGAEGGNVRITVASTPTLSAQILQARSSGKLYLAPSGAAQTIPTGGITVDDSVLKSLPLVERRLPQQEVEKEQVIYATEPANTPETEQVNRADMTAASANAIAFLAERALEAAGADTQPSKCALTIVRGGQRTQIEVPCK